jgi:hypothetical protein
MFVNKKGQEEIGTLFTIFVIIVILIFYFVFIVFGRVASGPNVESIIEANENISTLNYFPTLLGYLGTEVNYNGETRSMFSLIDEYSQDTSDKGLRDFLRVESDKIFSKLEYCTYSRYPSISSPVKTVFKVFIRKNSEHKSSEDEGLYGFISELGYPFVKQKLNGDMGVYLTVKEKVVGKGDCSHVY